MLVDLDYFFAQTEETRNPSIRDKPVVVCVYSGRSEDSGAVSTANYIARKFGVKSGMPIALAKSKLQNVDAVFLPVDDTYYEKISSGVMSILKRYADSFEQAGIDEAYLEVSQRTKESYEEATELAKRIKNEILTNHSLTCSIGIGPNKVIAKVASDAHKPDGLTVIEPGRVLEFLSPLPVDRLIGVGLKTTQKMRALGVTTIGDLAKLDVQRLVKIFGRKLGLYFHNAAAGIDGEPVQERAGATSISRISTLKEDTRKLILITENTDRLCEEIKAELDQNGLVFRTVTAIAIMKDLSVRSRSKSLDNTNRLEVLQETVKELFERYLAESTLEIRRAGVKVSGLSKVGKNQKELSSFFE